MRLRRSYSIGKLYIAWGSREWEIQGFGQSGELVNYSGPPYLTKDEVKRALDARDWSWSFFTKVMAVNVRSGERFPIIGEKAR